MSLGKIMVSGHTAITTQVTYTTKLMLQSHAYSLIAANATKWSTCDYSNVAMTALKWRHLENE